MPEKITYLYLDDNDKVTRDGDVELFNTISKDVEIKTDYPSSWKQRSKSIFTDLNHYDGIIIDWELTNQSQAAKEGSHEAEDVDFSAESLAEHLRVNAAKKNVKDIPIIICSADKNKAFSNLKNRELTRRDIFDLTYIKNDLFVKHVSESERQLFNLAIVYKLLQQSAFDVKAALDLSADELDFLDIRFLDTLEKISTTNTTHDLVYFLLQEFLLPEGLLINEQIVAARLGVDIEKSGDSWNKIKEVLVEEQICYKGLLSIGWSTYWSFKLVKWWNAISDKDLRTTSASTRVQVLNEKYGTTLIPAEKIKFCSSDEFWTVCKGTRRPLDPINGFIIGDYTSNPWLEVEYVSAYAELEKEDPNAWRISAIERVRFEKFKSKIVKND
ncbi:hypothetical protein [Sediminibacterium goheungense]|nr:hypothetical protein [Sediminibacterium goheungense]